jgi:hypothetical protein
LSCQKKTQKKNLRAGHVSYRVLFVARPAKQRIKKIKKSGNASCSRNKKSKQKAGPAKSGLTAATIAQ